MAAADASNPTPPLDEAIDAQIDRAIRQLGDGARTWRQLTLGQRATLLRGVRRSVGSCVEDWALTAAASKGLHASHPLRGEEWLGGPYAVLGAIDAYIATLDKLAAGRGPLDGIRLSRAPGGRVRVDAFPLTTGDRLLLKGFHGEVWLRPGVTPEIARAAAGLGQRTPGASGGIGLVLGAGNVSAIPVLDVLYELLAHNRVSLLKVNPTQDALVPVFEHALAPLIELGLLRIVRGGGDVGARLTSNPAFAHVHITGAARTFDAIVWGTDAKAERRKRENRPLLKAPITAELGGVSPIIVVPGEWSAADLAFQAEHIATMRLQNNGHNCIAGQVVLISADWPQREQFLIELRGAYARVPERPMWYPGSSQMMRSAGESYPDALQVAGRMLVEVNQDNADPIETTEYFAPVLGVRELSGTGQAFLDAAIEYANEHLVGTLGANVLIDPATQKVLGAGFEHAIANLRYGSIAVNAWTALGFIIPTLTWGASPGNTTQDVGSGLGIVHNALLLDRVERSIVRGPFRPFPRSIRSDRFTVLPKPPWFATSRTGAEVSEGLTRARVRGSIPRLIKTLVQALRA